MPDARGGYGSDQHTRILQACEKCWPREGPHGLANSVDCSGFVKSVMKELGLLPALSGDANAMYDAVKSAPNWDIVGTGSAASRIAGMMADEGRFVLALWKNPAGHGHVSVVVADMSNSLKQQRIESTVMGYWGQFGGQGKTFAKLTASYGRDKLSSVLYAAHRRTT